MKGAAPSVLLLVTILLFPGPDILSNGGEGCVPLAPEAGAGGLQGRFSSSPAPRSLPGSGTYRGIALGDIDRDGRPDLAAAGDGGIGVWAGDGAGNWTERTAPAGAGACAALALADYDHDGRLDIVAAGEQGVKCWDGDGAWTWTPGAAPIAGGKFLCVELQDINIDGNPDVVAGGAGGIRLLLGDGKGGWSAGTSPSTGDDTWYDLVICDFDLDGKMDIAGCGNDSGAPNGTVRVFAGDGAGGWSAGTAVAAGVSGPIYSIESADMKRDGKPDLVAAGKGGTRVWTGNGANGWTEGNAPVSGPDCRALVAKDLDRDGKSDIAAGDRNGTHVWLGDGTLGWPAAAARPLYNMSVLDLAAGDLDRDGKPDLAAAAEGKGLQVWLSDVPDLVITGWSAASTGLQGSGKWADVVFGDVNRDGKLDLVVTSYQNQNQGIRAYLGNGAGCWTNSSSGLPMNTSCSGARLVDFDRDGRLDLAATTDAGPAGTVGTRIWKGNGDGSWTLNGAIDTRSGAGLETGDLDNDGHADLATGFWGTAIGPMVFLGNGDLTFRPNSGPSSTLTVDDVAIGDANGDGDQDIAASTMNQKGVQFWTGNGTGAAASWKREDTGLPTTAVYLGLAMADVDGDGDLDLAATGYGPGSGLHVYLGDGGAGGTLDWSESSKGLPAAADFGGAELADIDLDGDLDLIGGNVSGGGLDLFFGNGGAGGSMTWTEVGQAPLPSSGNVWGVGFGDIDNDGMLDVAATPDGSGVRVWRTVVARPAVIDRVTISPASSGMEVEETRQFSAQAYYANGTPAGGLEYLWETDGELGVLDSMSGKMVNFTAKAAGTGALKVTARQGLSARNASAGLTIMAPPQPADVTVIPQLSVRPGSIWANGTNLSGHQENATVRIGLRPVGRNITPDDGLCVNFTLAQGIELVAGAADPAPNRTARYANGTTKIGWDIAFLENSSTFWAAFDVRSDVVGPAVLLNLPAASDVRYLNLSGPQLLTLDQLSLQVLEVAKEPPGPPLDLVALPGDGFVQLSWNPPAFDGNSSMTGYRIRRGGSEGNETPLVDIGNVTQFNDTNVTNGVAYYYKVGALNQIGEGPPAGPVMARPSQKAGPPGAPQRLVATSGDGSVSLSWDPPLEDGGSAVLWYNIYRGAAPGNGSLLATVANPSYKDWAVTICVTYYYSVSARNAAGEGPRTPEEAAAPAAPPELRPPSEPRALKALAGDGFVELSWQPPQDDGGAPITNYRVVRGTELGKGAVLKVLGLVQNFTDAGLANGQEYYYSVAAANRMGIGPVTQEVAARPWALPSAPRNLTAAATGDGKVRCSWDAPASDGGFKLAGYKVYRSEAAGMGMDGNWTMLGQVVDNSFLDATVHRGRTYYYKVAAVTERGEGAAAEPISARLPDVEISSGVSSVTLMLVAAIAVLAISAMLVALLVSRRRKGPLAPPNG